MDFNYSEEQTLIATASKEFAEQYIRPHIMEWDESQFFPADVLHKAGEMGFMGVFIPEQYGGSGFGYHEYIAIIEEISKVDPSIGLSIAAHMQKVLFIKYIKSSKVPLNLLKLYLIYL